MVAPLYTTDSGYLFHAGKILVITIGLPARGKTHISRSLERYLRWMGVKTQVVSLGDYRRKMLGGGKGLPGDYFSLGEKSASTNALRLQILEGCESQISHFFEHAKGQVVIYDANNGTRHARKALADKWAGRGVHVIMLESVCDNKEIIEANIRSVKISSPDYRDWDPDKAVEDYYNRIRDHEKYYEPVEEKDWPYIRIFNVGERIMVNNIKGYLQSRIVFFLMNIHNTPRTIYFARSGQSLIEHSYKADSDLSPAGWEYAERLKDFVLERRAKNLASRGVDVGGKGDQGLVIWTSTRRRAYHTAWPFLVQGVGSHSNTPGTNTPTPTPNNPPSTKVIEKPQMSEINPGIWDGLTPDQARKYYPADYTRFLADPYAFRAPRAESYHDLSVRLEPTLIELEREKKDLLIIGHASVIRCLLAYLIGLPASEIPAIEVARGDLLEVVPASYGVRCRAYHFWDGPGRVRDGDVGDRGGVRKGKEDGGKGKGGGADGGEIHRVNDRPVETASPDEILRPSLMSSVYHHHDQNNNNDDDDSNNNNTSASAIADNDSKTKNNVSVSVSVPRSESQSQSQSLSQSEIETAGISPTSHTALGLRALSLTLTLGIGMGLSGVGDVSHIGDIGDMGDIGDIGDMGTADTADTRNIDIGGIRGIGEQRDPNNFYENYAEDTKGKRRVVSFLVAEAEAQAMVEAKGGIRGGGGQGGKGRGGGGGGGGSVRTREPEAGLSELLS
ncbi:6-phosphofructo-2-kinase-domain-containing protein [Lentinula raphanica]|uniref:6-phosphofructo-2-kinase-domain-containing protein n=1 Tax=Lentinula raphanica TaxID=153919 RepID=A0AA38NW17_9AGAR|nr:6-phosphofructo-2-kinase-domain-containing protein [Lentinula raphanica]